MKRGALEEEVERRIEEFSAGSQISGGRAISGQIGAAYIRRSDRISNSWKKGELMGKFADALQVISGGTKHTFDCVGFVPGWIISRDPKARMRCVGKQTAHDQIGHVQRIDLHLTIEQLSCGTKL